MREWGIARVSDAADSRMTWAVRRELVAWKAHRLE